MPITPLRAATTAALISALAACTGHRAAGAPVADLLTSLQASTAGDSVHLLLQLTNPGTDPVVLELTTVPAAYFTIARDQLPVWSSVAELTPTEVVVHDTLHAGETRSFDTAWLPPMGLRGTMTATGVVRDRRGPLAQSTRFEIP